MNRAQAEEPLEALIAGRYRVEKALGEGGMAAVYAVFDGTTGRRVALKRLADGIGSVGLKLFEDEYRTLASLRHPGIVEVYEFGRIGEGAYYTMEILEGNDLSRSAPLPWREVCGYLRDAASILGVLHARRLVHRDVSPRNLWRTPDGKIKLLDFGSLALFGETREVVGTPAFIPPEALQALHIDQRTDLYALGALGYWLITSAHAYRARRLADLPALWECAPLPPSALVPLLDAQLPEVPKELDRLILALLSLDPRERPASTVDVIDRLNDSAGLQPESPDAIMRGYLESTAFVGRLAERQALQQHVRAAHGGNPSGLCFEGPEGIGRSRLLQELLVAARIADTIAVRVGREATGRPYGACSALALSLLNALPDVARRAAEPYAPALAEIADELSAALGRTSQDVGSQFAATARARKQLALSSWLLALSETHTLALIVDDVDLLDEESQAVLLTLLRSGAGHRLCVVTSVGAVQDAERSHALAALRASSTQLQLSALSADETLELLRSLFGEVPYLARLSARLHKLSEGNPEHCLLLARQLVAAGVIRYADGTWTLPQEFPHEQLPKTLRTGLVQKLQELSSGARSLARRLSVPDHGALREDFVQAASGSANTETRARLALLLERGVLQGVAGGYRFSHEVHKQALYEELAVEERMQVHRALALHAQSVAGADSLLRLRAALHWLRAGDSARAEPLLFDAGQVHMQATVAETLRQAAPMFADAVALLDAAGRTDQVLWLPLSALAYAGYFVDRRYADRFGARAISVLSAALQLDVSQRLSPWLGGRLGVIAAVATAALKLRRKAYVPELRQVIYCLVSATTTTAGCACISMDSQAVRRYAATLQPLARLRSGAVVRFLVQFNEALARIVEGKIAEAQVLLVDMAAFLESKGNLPDMPAETRAHYLAHALALYGLYDAWACKVECLDYAKRAEVFGPFHSIWANQVRTVYWAFMGQSERADHYEQQVELQAIQLGSAWQVESWKPFLRLVSLTYDAVATKRAADEMQRFGETMPVYRVYARWLRAAYCVLRGNYAAALELFQDNADEPAELLGQPVAHGWCAAAYNGLGQYERARALCHDAIAHMSDGNRKIVYVSVRVEAELALAEAGLGRCEVARMQLASLMRRHCPQTGPLVKGFLHCTQARVALIEQDLDGYRSQLEYASAEYGPLGIASLNEQLAALRHASKSHETTTLSTLEGAQIQLRTDGHFLTRMELILQSVGSSQKSERTNKALRLALELAGADQGFVVNAEGTIIACIGEPSAPAQAWALSQLSAAREDRDDETVLALPAQVPTQATHQFGFEGVSFRLELLWRRGLHNAEPTAALVMGATGAEPRALPTDVLRTIASGLTELRVPGNDV